MSDLLSCTCVGKPLSCSGRSSPGGSSTPVRAPVLLAQQQLDQSLQEQEQSLLAAMQEDAMSQQSLLCKPRECRIIGSSSGGVTFARGGGQQQLERQSSLLPTGDGDEDLDSDEESFGVFEMSNSLEGVEQRMRQHQQLLLQEHHKGSSAPRRPDTSSVSSDYIQRALAGLPEQPPGEMALQRDENPFALQREKVQQPGGDPKEADSERYHETQQQERQNDEVQPKQCSSLQEEESSNKGCRGEAQQTHGHGQNEEDDEATQEHSLEQEGPRGGEAQPSDPQEYSRWTADSCLSPYVRLAPPGGTREWLDSLERAEFVEQYLVPKVRNRKQINVWCLGSHA